MRPLESVVAWLEAKGFAAPVLPTESVRRMEAAAGHPFTADLRELYAHLGPGCEQVFSPVVHQGVLTSWPLWHPQTSFERMQRTQDPLWQLSHSVDIWLDTNEVTVLREDDIDESFPDFASYWAVRAAELEQASFDPMTGLWLHPDLHATRVGTDASFRSFLLEELLAGRELHLPGLGSLRPTAPPKSRSTFDLNPQGPPPSMAPEGLDRCEPVVIDASEVAARWGRDPAHVQKLVEDLHHAVDEALETGPVDLLGLFRLQARHHEARILANGDEPIEIPAHRQVTARVSLEVAEAFRGRSD